MLNSVDSKIDDRSKKGLIIIPIVLVCLFFVLVVIGIGVFNTTQSSTPTLSGATDNSSLIASTSIVAGSSINVPYGYEYGTGSLTKVWYWNVNGANSEALVLGPSDWITEWLTYNSGPLSGNVVPCSYVNLTCATGSTYTWTGLYNPVDSTGGQIYTVHWEYYIQLQNGTTATVTGSDESCALTQSFPTATVTNYVYTTSPST